MIRICFFVTFFVSNFIKFDEKQNLLRLQREAAEEVIFFNGPTTKRGDGLRGWTTKKSTFFSGFPKPDIGSIHFIIGFLTMQLNGRPPTVHLINSGHILSWNSL